MRQVLLICCLLIGGVTTINAQKVKIKNGIAKVDKKPFCKIDCHPILIQDGCKIMSLSNEVLATLKFHAAKDAPNNTAICEVIFANSMLMDGKNYSAQVLMKFKYREQIIKELYQYKAIQFGQLNEIGVQNFVEAHSENHIGDETETLEVTTEEENTYTLVERNLNKKIFVFKEVLQQDFKDIGKYKHEVLTVNNEVRDKYSFYLMNGTLIATATMETKKEVRVCEVITMKDNKTHYIVARGIFEDDYVEKIAKELVQLKYL